MNHGVSARAFRHALIVAGSFTVIVAGAFIVALRAADPVVTDWPSYNRTLTAERYAPFDQINRTNVSRLKQLCVYDLNVERSFQTGPIVIGRTLYATTDKEILAIDAETCQQKWRVREEGPSLGAARQPRRRLSRRPAVPGHRRRQRAGLRRGDRQETVEHTARRSGKRRKHPVGADRLERAVFIGTAGSDRYGVTGRVYALEAQTGKVVWETYTVPTDAPQPGNEKMQAQARATWGNTNGVPITGGGTWTTYHARCRARTAVRSGRQSRPGFRHQRAARAPISTPTRSSCWMRRAASTAVTTRSCRPISTTGIWRRRRCS